MNEAAARHEIMIITDTLIHFARIAPEKYMEGVLGKNALNLFGQLSEEVARHLTS